MVVKLGQDRKAISRIFVVLMTVLLMIFLANPANAITIGKKSKTVDNCEVRCTKYEEVTDANYKNERTVLIYSFMVGGVQKNLYVKYSQDCANGHYSRICTPFARCPNNGLCEQSGPIRTESTGHWERCSKWDIIDVWVATA